MKNERTKVRCNEDEALSYEKGEMEKTTHNVCESVKMQEKPAEEGKEVPFYDRESDEGSW